MFERYSSGRAPYHGEPEAANFQATLSLLQTKRTKPELCSISTSTITLVAARMVVVHVAEIARLAFKFHHALAGGCSPRCPLSLNEQR